MFSATPTLGNGLAVVIDAEGLSDAQMASFAAWTNLAETTFLLPPTDARADYRVKILTPVREMPFAGHPTLGSCAAWLHSGGVPKHKTRVRQECGVGIVDIDLTGNEPAFVAPPTRIEPMASVDFDAITSALSLDTSRIVNTACLENGPVWQVFELASADDVLAADSARVRWPQFQAIGLIGPHKPNAECDFEVRMLAPSSGMAEDPITGSLNSAIAMWMARQGRLGAEQLISQGTKIGRSGRVHIRTQADPLNPSSDKQILIGGDSHILIEGWVDL